MRNESLLEPPSCWVKRAEKNGRCFIDSGNRGGRVPSFHVCFPRQGAKGRMLWSSIVTETLLAPRDYLVGGFKRGFYFPSYMAYMGCHPSHWRTHMFQYGKVTTNQLWIGRNFPIKHHGNWKSPIDGFPIQTPIKKTPAMFDYQRFGEYSLVNNYGKSPCLMGKSTISMAIFHHKNQTETILFTDCTISLTHDSADGQGIGPGKKKMAGWIRDFVGGKP